MVSKFDTSFTEALRENLHVKGLLPPNCEEYSIQEQRCLRQIRNKSPLEAYIYLSHLRNSNHNLFYRLLVSNVREICPLIYTPTVGEACVKWSEIWSEPEGMYLSWHDKGRLRNVIANWPEKEVDITVVTDGSRILGLGDLGVNGLGISIGKLSLYVGCAGLHPRKTLPIVIDLGTDNEKYLEDPLYLGLRMKRLGEAEMMSFLDEMMAALKERWPSIVIQFEDFKNPYPALAKYQNMYTCFNDDIQGTGAVILGGVITAVKKTNMPLRDHKVVFFGAGSAGVGVATMIMEMFIKEGGISEEEAKRMFYLVDTKGLVTNDRGDVLAAHKILLSRSDNNGRQYKTLEEVVDMVKPSMLMGLSTTHGAFTPSILQKMAEFNDSPIIFPLSNPLTKAECTFEDAMVHTQERVIFASGSPFPTYTSPTTGEAHEAGQGNNMYVFPGIGLAAIVGRASVITNDMIYASAVALSQCLTPEETKKGWLYPSLDRIRQVSIDVAVGVIRQGEKDGVIRNQEIAGMNNSQLALHIQRYVYDPRDLPREFQGNNIKNFFSKISFPWGHNTSPSKTSDPSKL